MKVKYIILSGALLLGAFSLQARSPKRGVSENGFSMGAMIDALEPGSCWYYNWGNTPGRGYEDQIINHEGLEFVPMCWNGRYNADAIREYCRTHPQTKYLLGFNEPNFTAQANMTPQQAAELWPDVQALAKELNLKLVAPALNYSPNPPYTDPLRWMDEFVALVGPDAFDFTAIHNYGGLGVMQTLAGQFHERYGKDVWVTEFCYWPGEGQNTYVSPATQISSMIGTLDWLERTPWIYRYAWFKAMGASDAASGPNYGLLKKGATSFDWELSDQGFVYTYFPSYDPERIHTVGDRVEAVHYSEAGDISMGRSYDAEKEIPLDLTEFRSGAWAQYRFHVVEAGNYNLVLRVSGEGEPTRFNPTLKVSLVEGENLTELAGEQFEISGKDEEYRSKSFPVTLDAGDVTIRIADNAPFMPSGLRISSLCLVSASGVDGIYGSDASLTNLVALDGTVIASGITSEEVEALLSTLPKGVYISNGRKYLVK